jgi:ABC-type multidrug transport system ATPase subunit
MLLGVLNRLVDMGNTVIVIEHNLDVIKTADYIIDLGPEGGDAGGRIIATGTPEEVAKIPESFTGKFLADSLKTAKREDISPAARGNGKLIVEVPDRPLRKLESEVEWKKRTRKAVKVAMEDEEEIGGRRKKSGRPRKRR